MCVHNCVLAFTNLITCDTFSAQPISLMFDDFELRVKQF
jgi:hypothetical protein